MEPNQDPQFEMVREYQVWGVEDGHECRCSCATFEEAERVRFNGHRDLPRWKPNRRKHVKFALVMYRTLPNPGALGGTTRYRVGDARRHCDLQGGCTASTRSCATSRTGRTSIGAVTSARLSLVHPWKTSCLASRPCPSTTQASADPRDRSGPFLFQPHRPRALCPARHRAGPRTLQDRPPNRVALGITRPTTRAGWKTWGRRATDGEGHEPRKSLSLAAIRERRSWRNAL